MKTGICRLLIIGLVLLFGWSDCVPAAPVDVEQRAAQLRAVLQKADDAYYNQGAPILSDAAYDALRSQYAGLCHEYPELPAYDAVGTEVPDGTVPVVHTQPMLSLKKAYSDEDVSEFVQQCGSNQLYCVAPKIDGFSLILRYQEGQLRQALTRGDGKEGIDVTRQALASGCVPLVLTNAPSVLEVRGEAYLTFSAFEALNERRVADGGDALKSPRNSAVGTMRLKDLSEVAQRGLSFAVFEVVRPAPTSHSEGLERGRCWGLPVVPVQTVSGGEVIKAVETLNAERAALPYPSDGVVIRVDDCAQYAALGATERWPRGAIARKYKTKSVETRLLRVEWMQGETGRWTPVAHFEPVLLDGAELCRASLHSLEHLRALDLRIGDRILVTRSGGVIPSILGRVPDVRTGEEEPIPGPPDMNGRAL